MATAVSSPRPTSSPASSSSTSIKSSRSVASWSILRSRSSIFRLSPKAPPVTRFPSEPCVPSSPPEAGPSPKDHGRGGYLRSDPGRRPASAPSSRPLAEAHSRRISSIFSPAMSSTHSGGGRQAHDGNAMVHLSLFPHKGNHARHFPHAGYLGISPVIVAGTVKTSLKGNMTTLDAGKVVVRIRCYEGLGSSARQIAGGGIGSSRPAGANGSDEEDDWDLEGDNSDESDDHRLPSQRKVAVLWETEQVLWEAPRIPGGKGANQWEWAPLGDLQKEFRLVIPASAVTSRTGDRPGAAGSMTFKGWKVWWQVETVVFHRPFGMSGSKVIKSQLLRLVNYALAPPIPCAPPAHLPPTEAGTSQGAHPRLLAKVHAPTRLTAGDAAKISVSLVPTASGSAADLGPTTIKKVVLALERTITMDVTVDKPETDIESRRWRSVSPPELSPPPGISKELVRMAERGDRDRSASPAANRVPQNTWHTKRRSISGVIGGNVDAGTRPLRGDSPAPTSSLVTMVAVAEVTGNLGSLAAHEEPGAGEKWERDVVVVVPKPRSTYHYALGETCRTTFGRVKFHLVARVTFKTRLHGTETLETVPLEIEVGAVPRSDRKAATEHLARLVAPPVSIAKPPAAVEAPLAAIVVPPLPKLPAIIAVGGQVDDGDRMVLDPPTVRALPPPPVSDVASADTGPATLRPTSSHNVRRRSEASDAVDAPNRRRPRSARSEARRRLVEDADRPQLPSAAPVDHGEPQPRPRSRAQTGPGSGPASVAGRRIRPYPHSRPKSSSSQKSAVSVGSWSNSETSSNLSHASGSTPTLIPSSSLAWRSPSTALSLLPMQIESPSASPILPSAATPMLNGAYPSPPDESPAINFGAFTLGGGDSPALSTTSRPRQKYRGPFDKRRSPVAASSAVFVMQSEEADPDAPVNGLLAGPLPLPTPPSSAGSMSDNPPIWDPSCTSLSTEASEVATPLDPPPAPGSPDLSKQERKGSHKWTVFFRRASTFSNKATPAK